MEVGLKAVQIDHLGNTQTLLKDGRAFITDEDTLSYTEDADPNVRHTITFRKGVVIRRNAESETVIWLSEQVSKAVVRSPYGQIRLEAELVSMNKDEDEWSVEYRLYNQGELITHQTVIWSLKGAVA